MKIYIDDKELEIFSGARVKDALLKYSKQDYQSVLKDRKQVKDKWNNMVELNGELTDNQRLFIKSEESPHTPGGHE